MNKKLRINIVKERVDYLHNQVYKLNEIIDILVEPYEDYITSFCTIPGVDRKSAITVLSEIGTDMSQFSSRYLLTSWDSFSPGCNESAGKKIC